MSAAALTARLTRRSGSNFYYAFKLLPAPKRRAIYALYAFCRVVDDCVDAEDGEGEAGLLRWQDEVHRCYAGKPATELGQELTRALVRFPIPRSCFEDIIAGCRMDLEVARYATYEELQVYCRRVASAVGLASIEIFGYTRPATREYAMELGQALQLTNILRDIAVDLVRGRLYLPLEDLQRFGLREEEFIAVASGTAARDSRIDALLEFEGERAGRHYEQAAVCLPACDRRGMLAAEVMGAIYQCLFETLARRGFPLRGPQVRLSRAHKARIALRTLLRTYLR